MSLNTLQWVLAALGAFTIGVSKTGLGGVSILFIALFANVFPPRLASGLVVPMLIIGDLVAVSWYRRFARWKYLWKLFPGTAVGIVLGYLALGRANDQQTRKLIGGILLALVLLHFFRKWRERKSPAPVEKKPEDMPFWIPTLVGLLAGFATLVANGSGPIIVLYLLAMGLPKMEFIGTGAVFFLIMNLFKLPFVANLGFVTVDSLKINLVLAPAVVAGAYFGKWLIVRINQKLFELIALILTFIAALRLLSF